MSTDERFPQMARGSIRSDDIPDHMAQWNHAIERALMNLARTPGNTYQVNVVLSATIVEEENPGRITEYTATLI
jgi:hypothetical protein